METKESKNEDGNISQNEHYDKIKTDDMIPKRRLLLIDSSFLMLPVSSGKRRGQINIEDALHRISEGRILAVLTTTVEELKILKEKSKGKKRLAADFALNFIENARIKIVEVDQNIVKELKSQALVKKRWELYDEILAIMAKKLNATVATTDIELMHKLRELGVSVFYLRGKKWIYISGAPA